MDEVNIKIGDFGLACFISDSEMARTYCGTPFYMAPEVLKKQKYNNKADLWSLGVILFELLFGMKPFKGNDTYEILRKIEYNAIKFPASKNLSENVIDLLSKLLNIDPKKRIGMKELKKHPFIIEAINDLDETIYYDALSTFDISSNKSSDDSFIIENV